MKFFLGIITTLLIIIGYKEFQLNHCKGQFKKAKENTFKLQKETTERQQEIENKYEAKQKQIKQNSITRESIDKKTLIKNLNIILKDIENEINK